MEFFLMYQDSRINDMVQLLHVSKKIDIRNLNKENIDKIQEPIMLYVKEKPNNEYVDLISHPIFLVSEKLKDILEKYVPNTIFKTVIMVEKGKDKQEIYYLMVLDRIDSASEESVVSRDGSIKTLVLDSNKVGNHKIFWVENFGQRVVIRLDVAESILRRDFIGIRLERLEIKENENV